MIRVSAKGEEAERVALRAYELLWDEQPLRTTTSDILLEAEDGILRLSGRVRTNTMRELAHRLALSAIDGWQLKNDLVSDDALAMDVAARLAADPRSSDASVRCDVFLGAAYLKGTVRSAEQRDLVVALASQTPNVVGVKDMLTIVQ